MAQISKSVAILRILGDDLIPTVITDILGSEPTYEQIKGQVLIGNKTRKERIVKTGMWRLAACDQEPENIDGQILEILGKLSPDLTVWQSITRKIPC